MPDSATYVVGGNVALGAGTYIERNADKELLDFCRAGEYVYILAPRQVGKTSVMGRASTILRNEGLKTVEIDLSPVKSASPDEWYRFILVEIASQLDLSVDVIEWWNARSQVPWSSRFLEFLQHEVLAAPGRVVVFVDEIDAAVGLKFAGDFFAAVRYAYQKRARNPRLKDISFVLIGSASPTEIISDPKQTPFNIGKPVELIDFTEAEARPLADGLGLSDPNEARQVLRWILEWTGGHPYLTQKVCYEFRRRSVQPTQRSVEELAGVLFFGAEAWKDINLKTVSDMLLKRDHTDPALVLRTYREVLRGNRVKDQEQSPVKSHLKLTGVVKRNGELLAVRNKIYGRVFDEAWIEQNIPPQTRLERQIRQLLRVAAVAVAALIILFGVTIYIYAQKQKADRATADLAAARNRLQKALVDTRNALEKADKESVLEKTALVEADRARQEADDAAAKLQIAVKDAQKSRLSAEASKSVAITRADGARAAEAAAAAATVNEQKEREKAQTAAAEAKKQAAIADANAKEADQNRRAAARALARSLAAQVNGSFPVTADEANQHVWQAVLAVWTTFDRDRYVVPEAKQALANAAKWIPLFSTWSRDVVPAETYFPAVWHCAINDRGVSTVVFRDILSDWSVSSSPSFSEPMQFLRVPGGINVQAGHSSSSALSADGSFFAVADDTGIIRIHDLTTLRERIEAVSPEYSVTRSWTIRNHYPIQNLAFSPDGRLLAASDAVQTLRIFDWRKLKELWHRPKEPTTARIFKASKTFGDPVSSFAFSRASDEIAVAFGREIQIYKASDGSTVGASIPQRARSLAFGSGGLFFTSDTALNLVTGPGQVKGVMPVSNSALIATSSQGSLIVAADSDKWSLAHTSRDFQSPDLGSPLTALAADPSGKYVLTGTASGTLRLWSVDRAPLSNELSAMAQTATDQAWPPILAKFQSVLRPLAPSQCQSLGFSQCPDFTRAGNFPAPAR